MFCLDFLLIYALFMVGLDTFVLFDPPVWLQDLLQLRADVETSFRLFLLGMTLVNLAVSVLYELLLCALLIRFGRYLFSLRRRSRAGPDDDKSLGSMYEEQGQP